MGSSFLRPEPKPMQQSRYTERGNKIFKNPLHWSRSLGTKTQEMPTIHTHKTTQKQLKKRSKTEKNTPIERVREKQWHRHRKWEQNKKEKRKKRAKLKKAKRSYKRVREGFESLGSHILQTQVSSASTARSIIISHPQFRPDTTRARKPSKVREEEDDDVVVVVQTTGFPGSCPQLLLLLQQPKPCLRKSLRRWWRRRRTDWFSLLLLLLFCNCWSEARPSKQSAQASEWAKDESNAVRRRAQDLGCNSSEKNTATLTAVPPRLRRRRARVGRVRGERARRGGEG